MTLLGGSFGIMIGGRIILNESGDVYMGTWQDSIPVAVKKLKESDNWNEFEQEASILK